MAGNEEVEISTHIERKDHDVVLAVKVAAPLLINRNSSSNSNGDINVNVPRRYNLLIDEK
ncbi:hypothetical protein ABEB36_004014 [Hypothenemus hampei]|uniref:Uncharacterized protein n=1 Tax=Hypothenemus hampei TaxID=57062 RepID=A0ABD1F526_HYPHA